MSTTPQTDESRRTDSGETGPLLDEMEVLERELAATERLRFGADADRRRLRAEVEKWQSVAATMSAEREHNANEAGRLRAEVERLMATLSAIEEDGTSEHNAAVGLRQNLVAVLALYERAEAELARLRAEVERLTKQIKDDNRAYGCELRDPNGTIWEQAAKDHARAERAEAELAAIKQGHGELGKYEQLRLKNAELHDIIERASVQFFHEGTDGEILTKMLTILNEAK